MINRENISLSAEQNGLINENLIDASSKRLAGSKFETNTQAVRQADEKLNTSALSKEQKFKSLAAVEQQERDHGLLRTDYRRDKIRKNISNKIDDEN